MKPPSEITDILARLLETGLLRIRGIDWSDDERRCAIEADHIHNLPHLLLDYAPERLAFYWDVERAAYCEQVPPDQREEWKPLWERLQPHVTVVDPSTPARVS